VTPVANVTTKHNWAGSIPTDSSFDNSSLISDDSGVDVRHYLTLTGADPFQSWLDELKDLRARVAILRRVDRLLADSFGDHKYLGEGVSELRVDVGPGYRVYYGKHGKSLLLLLCAGSKRTQATDIARAVAYWAEHERRRQ
jgi:putative addiction module killer protein